MILKMSSKVLLLALFLAFGDYYIFCRNLGEDEFPVKLIKKEKYPVEVHEVLTEDGYILTFHRMPGKFLANSIPVYLQHGLLSGSGDWILSGKNDSLAYFLWDNGFDVWIGNARGNTYSKRHKTLSIEDPEFWNFSFHELGIYDVPANINYITRLTNKKIFYVGHSMGCSTFSIMAINRPEVARNVRAMIALAPAPYEFHIRKPIFKWLARHQKFLMSHAKKLEVNEFIPRNFILNFVANRICTIPLNVGPTICRKIINIFEGSHPRKCLAPLIAKSWPSGTSVKLFVHWLQHMKVNKFQQFDYGSEGNMEIYGNSTPPEYNLFKIKTPIAVFYSDDDKITASKDVLNFYEQLPVKLGLYKVGPSFGHMDFLWGAKTTKRLNEPILKIFRLFM